MDDLQSSTLSTLVEEIANHLFDAHPQGRADHDVWDALQRLSQEFAALQARNHTLAVQVARLESQLQKPLVLTDEDVLSELPGGTARVLAAARDVAEEIIERANNQAAHVARQADQHAAELTRRAATEATQTLHRAKAEADRKRHGAHVSEREILTQGQAARDMTFSELEQRRASIEAAITKLQADRAHLLDAYHAVKRTFEEASHRFTREVEADRSYSGSRAEGGMNGGRRTREQRSRSSRGG